MLAQALGQGIGHGVNMHQANKALDEFLNNPELKEAPQSERMGALQRAMQGHGPYGQQVLQNRMQTEQLATQEKQQKEQNIKGDILRRRLSGEPITEKEKKMFTAEEEMAIAKHQQAKELAQIKANNKAPLGGLGGQPIDPQVANEIERIVTENPDATPDQLGIALTKAGVPPANQTPYLENRRRQLETNASLLEKGYKSQESYLNDLTKSLNATEQMDEKLDRIAELGKKGNVPEPLLYETMQALGIPTALFSAEGEELEKLSNDLTKNIQQFYGSRILQSEFQNFLKSIPTLKNSQEGRERIIENMKMFNNLKRLEYNTARALELDYEAKNKPLPPSFQRMVYDKMKPEAEKFSNEWKNAQKARLNPKKEVQENKPGISKYKAPDGSLWEMTPEQVEKAKEQNVIFSPA
jgi:hypothetical protein